MGGRGERVVGRVDDVAPPVGAGGREPQVARGHELGLAERPRPGAGQLLGRNVAAVDDLQGRHQLGAEIVLPLAHAGEGRERLHQRPLAHLRAEIRFDPPDRGDHVAADAVGLLGVGERAGVLRHRRLAVGDPLLVDQARDIVPDRRLELRLLLLEFQHLHVGLKPAEGLVERGGAKCRRARRRRAAPRRRRRNRPGRGG